MTITKAQALTAHEFHYTGKHECARTIGPRGGIKERVTAVRRNGKTQVWKSAKRAYEFRVPVKYGMYEYGYIDHTNADNFHIASECPLLKCEHVRKGDDCATCAVVAKVNKAFDGDNPVEYIGTCECGYVTNDPGEYDAHTAQH